MPAYQFRCRTCGDGFVVQRAMSESTTAAACPTGHTDTTRVFTAVAVGGRSNGGAAPSPAPVAAPAGGGGCCGGGCCG